MANLFNSANAPEGEPVEVVAGDFFQWKKSSIASDYPTASGFTAEYVARIQGGADEFKVSQDAGSNENYYLFAVSSLASAAFTAGKYFWQLEITETSSGNRVVVETGNITVNADIDINNADRRSHAELMVQKIESLLAGKADSDVSSYSIAGRSLTKLTFSELLEARNFYKGEAAKEMAASNAKKGISGPSTIKVRF